MSDTTNTDNGCKLYYECTAHDYKIAVEGMGNSILVRNWKDKPHRLVYDLCAEVERLRRLLDANQIQYESVKPDPWI
jgi:hypothetical protein